MHVKYCTIILKKLLKSKKWREDMERKEEKDVVKMEIMKALKKEVKWYNKIFINIFPNIFFYVYRKGVVDYFKYYNK